MKLDYIRSSSINSYKFCSWQYFLNYFLGMESLAGKAALQGTIVHSVLEWVALSKKHNKKMPDIYKLLAKSFDYHTKRNPHVEIRKETSRGEAADYKKCRVSIEKVIESAFNPYKLNIIETEKKFSVPLNIDGLEPFNLNGTIDLTHEISEDTMEIVDWKTGKQLDFIKMLPKDFYALYNDVQPRLYHLAAFLMYPKYKNILVTFNYMNEGGPTTLPYSFDDLTKTFSALHRFVKKVRDDEDILRSRTWKCSKFCFYGRNGICDMAWKDRYKYGTEYVKQKYHQLNVVQQKQLVENENNKNQK